MFLYSWMTSCLEWLTGSPSLNASDTLYFYVYLVVSEPNLNRLFITLLTLRCAPGLFAVHECHASAFFFGILMCSRWHDRFRWVAFPMWFMVNLCSSLRELIRRSRQLDID